MPFPRVFLSRQRNVAHYIDDYRLENEIIILCKWKNNRRENLFVKPCKDDSVEICKTCVKVSEKYPTKDTFFEHHKCTDCGKDLWKIGQGCYKIVNAVWKIAYPEYRTHHPDARPCFQCLEKRIERPLINEDFVYIW